MSNRSTVYSSNKVTINFGGLIIDSGRGEAGGDFLRIEQDGDDFDYKQSTDGEGVFWQLAPGKTTVTLILLQMAKSNAVLSALHIASKLAGGMPAPLVINDSGGTGAMISSAGLISKTPDETYAQEPGTVEWAIIVHAPDRIVNSH
jgi:Protein of unknown function (DUF3277)